MESESRVTWATSVPILVSLGLCARVFFGVILSSCHHSLCMYVCYVYFNKDQSINLCSRLRPDVRDRQTSDKSIA